MKKTDPIKLSLQDAFDELEKLTASLERGEGSLETSIPALKRGHELASYIANKLNALELEIKEVSTEIHTTSK